MKTATTLATLMTLILLAVPIAGARPPSFPDKISPDVRASLKLLQPGEMLTVIVHVNRHADLASILGQTKQERLEHVVVALQATAAASQAPLRVLLRRLSAEGLVSGFTPLWVLNGLSVTATRDVILELADRADVESITPDAIDIIPASGTPEPNISFVGADRLWNLGYSGQGVVVANMDTGVDASHPDLAYRWRGGTNSWFDPYKQHSTPADLDGHGTWTMGVMVGGDADGTSIGIAPGAQWIAVKIFNDRGRSRATAIHEGFQWLLDPDGDPSTMDAPDVVNNSWSYGGPGCNLEFQPDLQALRAAGILPVFAAGNFGPGASTGVSPANYPEALAVGATDNGGSIYAYSSRGPSACGEPSTVYPELVAPGVSIKSTDLFGFYAEATGTSFSAPHVAGAIALLKSAYPDFTADQIGYALLQSATDFGGNGPDNTFGFGGLDIEQAFNCLADGTCSPPLPPPPPLELQCASDSGQVGIAYLSAVSASGGTTPYEFSITGGGLPPDLTLDSSSGTISGTPSTAGNYSYEATVLDSTAGMPLGTAETCSISIALPPQNVHIGDLDGFASAHKSTWSATVTVTAHDDGHNPVGGVAVTGVWSGGYSGTGLCTTGEDGRCRVASGSIPKKKSEVTFTVTGASGMSYTYQSAVNHDPDADSNGTVISISKP